MHKSQTDKEIQKFQQFSTINSRPILKTVLSMLIANERRRTFSWIYAGLVRSSVNSEN